MFTLYYLSVKFIALNLLHKDFKLLITCLLILNKFDFKVSNGFWNLLPCQQICTEISAQSNKFSKLLCQDWSNLFCRRLKASPSTKHPVIILVIFSLLFLRQNSIVNITNDCSHWKPFKINFIWVLVRKKFNYVYKYIGKFIKKSW